VRTQLKKYNDACVQAFLKGETGSLLDNVKSLSGLFLENFKPMIPARFEQVWKQGLETNATPNKNGQLKQTDSIGQITETIKN